MSYQVRDLRKSFGNLEIYKDFQLEIPKGKITCILGPSGCGKTTLLKIISGIVKPDAGNLEDFNDLSISYLFQENRLLPWKTLGDNISYILKSRFDKKDVNTKIKQYLGLVQLGDYEHYYPNEVSGGMNQRISMARAFAYPSELLLMDEPFKGLDLKLKKDLISVFIDLWLEDQRTVIYITHSMEEALMLGDEVYVFSSMPVTVKNHLSIPFCKKNRLKKKCCIAKYKKELYNSVFS